MVYDVRNVTRHGKMDDNDIDYVEGQHWKLSRPTHSFNSHCTEALKNDQMSLDDCWNIAMIKC